MYNAFRALSLRNRVTPQARRFNFVNRKNLTSDPYFDQYSAHSPIQISRHGTEELRSKIFFEHPPIPNRVAKFAFLFCCVATFSTGVRDKILRRNRRYIREQERQMFRLIAPFVQAMEDLRYTAVEMKDYMVIKSVSDAINPSYFEHIRWRFHQEDLL